jgi:hypothetical protein
VRERGAVSAAKSPSSRPFAHCPPTHR